jgi:hypothetical protein
MIGGNTDPKCPSKTFQTLFWMFVRGFLFELEPGSRADIGILHLLKMLRASLTNMEAIHLSKPLFQR